MIVTETVQTLQLLRETIRRFVEKEVVPKAHAWEEQGCVRPGANFTGG